MTPIEHMKLSQEIVDKQNPGGTAFPLHFQTGVADGVPCFVIQTGMSLRDWFAEQFANGILSDSVSMTALAEMRDGDPGLIAAHLARRSYQLADAMLEERKQNHEP